MENKLKVSATNTRTANYRIEKREVWIICVERPADAERSILSGLHLSGDSWTKNGEELTACDSQEEAQRQMQACAKRFASMAY